MTTRSNNHEEFVKQVKDWLNKLKIDFFFQHVILFKQRNSKCTIFHVKSQREISKECHFNLTIFSKNGEKHENQWICAVCTVKSIKYMVKMLLIQSCQEFLWFPDMYVRFKTESWWWSRCVLITVGWGQIICPQIHEKTIPVFWGKGGITSVDILLNLTFLTEIISWKDLSSE